MTIELGPGSPGSQTIPLCGHWPRIVRTWSVAANFPIYIFFCHHFQTGTNQRKPPMFSKPIISYTLLLDNPPPASPGLIISDQNLHEASPFVFTVKLPYSSVCHWVFAKHKRWWLTPVTQQTRYIVSVCSHLGDLHLFLHQYMKVSMVGWVRADMAEQTPPWTMGQSRNRGKLLNLSYFIYFSRVGGEDF